jgi:MerR family redox-sensitive transcriptional activator SoxR
MLRRLAFVAAAQRVGLSLDEVARQLATLPEGRAPTRADWSRLARPWKAVLGAQMAELEALQKSLDGCIGCGCLSLQRCRLFNPDDEAAAEGPGSRWLREAAGTPVEAQDQPSDSGVVDEVRRGKQAATPTLL